ncbi:MAG: serine/threonine-protein kinase [Planctomycetes bacterium]|nr:serine/threonine-protein kinase [Planctomycetota bacterium]
MSDDLRALAEGLYQRAVDLPPEQRAALLQQRAGTNRALRIAVERLLHAYEQAPADFLRTGAAGAGPAKHDTVPPRIDRYQIIRELGEGGCGTVYLARQESPVCRDVAMKVIRLGMDTEQTLARFATEQQILAIMDHPNIAKVYDAGITEQGRPYFVMECVAGVPVTEYCAAHELSVAARLRLFIQVCGAVQHAHQKGIIHRDIKPSNILVDRADDDLHVPKVIDFGIAKALAGSLSEQTLQTEPGQLIGTPQYMSPEQCYGDPHDIDTRCDVYALGIVLYELLVGCTPYDLRSTPPLDIPRVMREIQPARLSTINRVFRGDLETIVHKALEKDPQRRYQTARDLSRDIERYLANEPIEAKRDSYWYVLRKTLQQHRAAVAVAATFVVLLVVFGAAMALMYGRAEAEAGTARRVQQFLQEILAAANPYDTRQTNRSLRELLDDTTRQIEATATIQPRVRAAVQHTLGVAYANLGVHTAAENHLQAALETRRTTWGAGHPAVAETMSEFGGLRHLQGRDEEAETLLRAAIAVQRRLAPEDQDALGSSLTRLAFVLVQLGQYDKAEAAGRESAELAKRLHGPRHFTVADGLSAIACALQQKTEFAAAESLLRQALDIDRSYFGGEHAVVARDLNNLAFLLRNMGGYTDVEQYHREALEIQRRILGKEHPDVATSLDNLAAVLKLKGDLAAAEPLFREALAMRRRLLGDCSLRVALSWLNLASCLEESGAYNDAEQALRQALAVYTDNARANHPDIASALCQLGGLLRQCGRYDEAKQELQRALNIQRKTLGSRHADVLVTLNNLAIVYQDERDWASAEQLLREALGLSRELLGDEHPHVAVYLGNLGAVLRDLGKHAEAEQYLYEALTLMRKTCGSEQAEVANTLQDIGRLHLARGEYERAEQFFNESLALRRRIQPATPMLATDLYWLALTRIERGDFAGAIHPLRQYVQIMEGAELTHWYIPANKSLLGACLMRLRRFDEAEPLLIEAHAELQQQLGSDATATQTALQRLIDFYEAVDQPAKAAAYRARRIDPE